MSNFILTMISKQILYDRAQMLQKARLFFNKRGVCEVDVGCLVEIPANDSHIDLIATDQNSYLHSSPEYALKKLLSKGIGDCYYLGHVFRKDEKGTKHNPEFTMAEWYRIGFSLTQMIEETAAFLFLFLNPMPIEILSYQNTFQHHVGIDPFTVPLSDLQKYVPSDWDRKSCLDYLMTHEIEPHLGNGCFTVIQDYPIDQAALAQTVQKGVHEVALRFEVYHQGVELANGYHELTDAIALKQRFDRLNRERIQSGKDPYPIDAPFLEAMKTMPDCCGVALGFDRAFMLKHKLSSIQKAIPF